MLARAFTLIELLVVVAIIAILAAIAIPNFLEAQTRAKVSRAKNDMKVVVTALETYMIDNNRYPTYHYANVTDPALHFHLGGTVPSFAVPDPTWNGRNPITTPIAYITAMPRDPFARQVGDAIETSEFLFVNWDYAIERTGIATFPALRASYGPYRLHSRGPDLKGPDSGTPYDPTNGTVSRGDVTWGPNTGFDKLVL